MTLLYRVWKKHLTEYGFSLHVTVSLRCCEIRDETEYEDQMVFHDACVDRITINR